MSRRKEKRLLDEVRDVDYQMKQLVVRSGKGGKDRMTIFPMSIIPILKNHLEKVKIIHDRDLSQGYSQVHMPNALSRKYPAANTEWGWQYVFPSRRLYTDPRSGKVRRHHITDSLRP
jgi:hypothetical protein